MMSNGLWGLQSHSRQIRSGTANLGKFRTRATAVSVKSAGTQAFKPWMPQRVYTEPHIGSVSHVLKSSVLRRLHCSAPPDRVGEGGRHDVAMSPSYLTKLSLSSLSF